MLETREPGVYHQSRYGTSAKQVRVADAGPERKLRKALLRGVLRAAQLPAEERNEKARALQSMRSRTTVRLPSLQAMRRGRANTASLPQTRKSKKRL